jgi:hypothetical protein
MSREESVRSWQYGKHQPVIILLLSIGASVAWTVLSGQDLNFDLITYHYYVGYSAFADRLNLDFLPASYQGYQSPVPYALLYLLDSMGTPPVVNACLHAAIHSLNLTFLFLITESLVAAKTDGRDRITVIAFWLLGAIAPVYWSLVGTSFADLPTSVPVLAGLWLIARAISGADRLTFRRLWWIAAGAALAGVAAGIRLHNAIYVVGLLCAIVFTRFPDPKSRFRAIGTFSAAAFAGWLLFFAPWAYRLYQEFGNPLFPLYNGLFRSPDFPASNLPIASFTPENLSDLLTFPFRIATYAQSVYGETRLPDVRPGLLVIGLFAFAAQWLFRRTKKESPAVTTDSESARGNAATAQCRRIILIFFAASAFLWLATSSNGRYGVALFLLGGPVCGVMLSRLLPSRYVLLIIAAVLLWQILLQQLFFRQYRPPSTAWASHYFDWDLPDRLKREPETFLSFSYRTASALAPYVHPDSAHANLVGQYTPGVDTPGSDRIRRIIDGHRPVYGVFDLSLILQKVPDTNAFKTYFRSHVRFWGLDFTEEPCDLVRLKPPAGNWSRLNRIAEINTPDGLLTFVVCGLRPGSPGDQQHALAELRNFQEKLLRFGTACAQYFGKPLSYIRVFTTWTVTSFASFEMRLDFHDDGAFYLQQGRAPYAALELGRMTGNEIIAYEPDCRKWFSRLSELSAQAARAHSVAPSR